MSAALVAIVAAAAPWSSPASLLVSFALAFFASEALQHRVLSRLRFLVRAVIVVPACVFAAALVSIHLIDGNVPVRIALSGVATLCLSGPIAIGFALPLERVRAGGARGIVRHEEKEMMVALGYGAASIGALALATAREHGNGLALPDHPFAFVFGVLAVSFATFTLITCSIRRTLRTRFLRRTEAGSEPGFLIENTEGKRVLIRHRVGPIDGYRENDMREELFELDADGELRERATR